MHALGRIHRSLRPDGVLLDLHPEPVNTSVEVWQEGRVNLLGKLDDEEDIWDVRRVRAHLDSVERRGWFRTERRRTFDLLAHYHSVEAWLDRRSRERTPSIIPEGILVSAHRLLAEGGGELVIREPIRATRLIRPTQPG